MNRKGVMHTVLLMLAVTLLVLPVSGAFEVTGIIPGEGLNTGQVFISNLSGTDLPEDASVNLMLAGQDNITGQLVYWESPTRITCVLDLAGKKAGTWDVVVVNNTDGSEAVLSPGFIVKNPVPTLTGIDPVQGTNNGTVMITSLSGTGFLLDATVNLTDGITTIPGTSVVVVSGVQITCEFDISGASPGLWDVWLTNEDGKSAILPDGFLVTYPPPAVYTITPSSGTNNEVIGITNLSGANFLAGATVHLARTNESSIPTINDPIVQLGKILCFFDLNGKPVGTWDVVVTNTADGQEGVLAGGFSIFYPQAPAVTAIDPDNGENDAPVTVLMRGTGFEPGATASLLKGGADIPGSNVLVFNATAMSCDFEITSATTGAWDVQVKNDDGQSFTLPGAFLIRNPAPDLTGIDPGEGLNSETALAVTLTGTWFRTGATVVLMKGGQDNITVTVDSVTPAIVNGTVDLTGAATGPWSVVLTNTDGQSDLLADAFMVAYPPPVATAIDPVSGVTGQTVPVTITGNAFRDGASVNLTHGMTTIPGTISTIMASEITCTFDLTGAALGAWDLEVTNDDGKSDLLTGAFTVIGLPPILTPPVVPQSGFTGEASQPLVINGAHFQPPGVTVNLTRGTDTITGSVAPSSTSTTLNCYFDLTGAPVGAWDVVVTNDDGQSGSLSKGFTIFYPAAPMVIAIDPPTGVNTGIVPITNLSGTGFMDGASVTLMKDGQANISGTEVFVASPGQITCNFNLAMAAVGLWDVVVENDDGKSGILADGFEVRYPAPGILGISPAKGINTAPAPVTITGAYFRDPAEVWLVRISEANIYATDVVVVNSTTITCTLPITGKKTGNWTLVVINPDDQYDFVLDSFRIENPAPTVASITPAKGPNDSTVFISALTGTGFLPNATVLLLNTTESGWITATNVTVVDPTLITCNLNLTGRAIGFWHVAVVNTDTKSGVRMDGFEITPPLPVPGFTASPLVGTAPLRVQFTDQSANDPTTWTWDFGDGSVQYGGPGQKNPVHTYNEPGVYTASLTVSNPAGTSLTTATAEINVVLRPVANFTPAEPVNGPAPFLVQFTDTSDGSPTRWLWRFGDGQYSTEKNPYHLYEKPGKYTVLLTVFNRHGSDTIIRPGLIEVTPRPVASFTANRTSGTSPLAVRFTDTSTGAPTSWSWVFGDGGTSNAQHPVHVFQNTGVYSVQLTVSNPTANSTETKNGYIVVGDLMRANFEFVTSNADNTAPLTVAFTDRSSGKPLWYTWKFGDGFQSTDKNPIHTYTRPGTYTVTLTVTGDKGTDSISKTIEVKSLLRAEFVAEPTTGSAPLTVTFSDISIGTVVARNWIIIKYAEPQVPLSVVFIENGPKNLVYTFNQPGTYDVMLDVWDEYGSSGSKEKPGYITVLPFP